MPVQKHIAGPKMEYKGDFSIPFNEKNPLNYVKPITVNIYFKQQTPCVGQYDPKRPEKNIQGAKAAFKATVFREIIKAKPDDLSTPVVGQYDI